MSRLLTITRDTDTFTCFDKFKEFKAEVENKHGKRIKSLRSDRGGEYLSGEFLQYLSDVGITSQLTALEHHNKTVWRREEIERY